jgi:parallel beta-helix repeat protein
MVERLLRTCLGLVIVAACLATSSTALAGTKVIEPDCGVSLLPGFEIVKPGNYLIRNALPNCNRDPIVLISANDVTLDLGGRLLQGDGGCLRVIHIGSGRHDVVVRNGTVVGCSTGIQSQSKDVTISGVVSLDAVDTGMESRGKLTRNVVVDSGGYGMRVEDGGTATKNLLVANGFVGLDGDDPSVLASNVVAANGSYGVFAGDEARGNVVAGNLGEGILSGDGSLIERNTIRANNGNGIVLEDSTASGNTIAGNTGAGIEVSETGSKVVGNRADGNTQEGIAVLAAPNLVRENTARGNLVDGISASAGNTIKGNTVHGNLNFGVNATPPVTGGASNGAVDNGEPTQCLPLGSCHPDTGSGGTPVSIDCGAGLTISTPGTYRLTRSVLNCSANPAIFIDGSDVTLDLQGRRVDGTDVFLSMGISVAADLHDVTIRNGVVSDFFVGVDVGGEDTVAQDLVVTSNPGLGIGARPGARLVRNTVTFNGSGGAIQAPVGDVVIHRNMIASNDLGISAPSSTGSTITNNVIAGNTGRGIDAVSGNTITGNRVVGNGNTGIFVDDGNQIRDNVVIANGTAGTNDRNGILGDASNVVSGNVVRANSEDGIGLNGDGAKVIRNKVNGNFGHGVYIDANGAIVRDNSSNGNTGSGIVTGPTAKINDNNAHGNVLDGINAVSATGGGNSARFNGGIACTPSTLC